ncbi:hypothetical protein [Frankia sp. Cppng1_Ct_nod]|uniref:hypothetical protein n=1 Tax=Frankia sp. Cppng1_Ct_nod TaxID=2897162 RepID=UPI001040F648|nr:hypothetical protein [Frankia sp. Cppng1_Ct_nod]
MSSSETATGGGRVWLAVLGPPGSGKSTVTAALTGLFVRRRDRYRRTIPGIRTVLIRAGVLWEVIDATPSRRQVIDAVLTAIAPSLASGGLSPAPVVKGLHP